MIRFLAHLRRSAKGAFDLASVMVGVIVIGIMGAAIAATVFAVIPWTQNHAAKQALGAVSTAESVARVTTGHYMDGSALVTGKLLPQTPDSVKIAVNSAQTCWLASSTSAASSKTAFYESSGSAQPSTTKPSDCDAVLPGSGPAEESVTYSLRTESGAMPDTDDGTPRPTLRVDFAGLTPAECLALVDATSEDPSTGGYGYSALKLVTADGSASYNARSGSMDYQAESTWDCDAGTAEVIAEFNAGSAPSATEIPGATLSVTDEFGNALTPITIPTTAAEAD